MQQKFIEKPFPVCTEGLFLNNVSKVRPVQNIYDLKNRKCWEGFFFITFDKSIIKTK